MALSSADTERHRGGKSGKGETHAPPPDDVQTDGQHLDWVFDRALVCFEDGAEPELSALVSGREHLLREIEQVVELARQAASRVGGPAGIAEAARRPEIPGYRILAELGHGGMGVVYLARQEKLGGRPVALKVLSTRASLSGRSRERFKREALAIARLHHPGVVAVYDLIEETVGGMAGGGVQAFAMEWVDGRSLGELIDGLARHQRELARERTRDAMDMMGLVREMLDAGSHAEAAKDPAVKGPGVSDPRTGSGVRPVGETLAEQSYVRWVCRVGLSVARALDVVHRTGMLHRDVKPSNVLIRRDGAALLSDFGLVRDGSGTITQAGHFAGTLAYAPPEQLRGEQAGLDARMDVYALGATLYHALALRPSVDLAHGMDGALGVLGDRIVALRQAAPRVPGDLSTIVAKAMDVDRARRYETAGELADDLERFLALRPIRARRAGLMARGRKMVLRNRLTLAASVFTLIATLALVGGIVFWFLVRPPMVAERLRRARGETIATAPMGSLFNKEFWGIETRAVPLELRDRKALASGLIWYDRAAALAPLDGALARERAIVRAARREYAQDMSIDAREGERAGRVVGEYLRWWRANAKDPDPNVSDSQAATGGLALDGMNMEDLGAVGLAAFLVGDADTAVDAWARVDVDRDPGELAEAGLGLLYLIRDQPARAYPRLRRAADAFPGSSNLQLDAAEAALRCGDTQKAAALISRARAIGDAEAIKFERVWILWQLRSGHEEAGMARYEQSWEEYRRSPGITWSPVLALQVGDWLVEQGRLAEACEMFGQACVETYPRRVLERLVPSCDRWWAGVGEEERLGVVRRVMDEPWGFSHGSEGRRLLGYAVARARGIGPRRGMPTELEGVIERLGMTETPGAVASPASSGWNWPSMSAEKKDGVARWVCTGIGAAPEPPTSPGP